jgi:hypothetical protein
MQMTPTRNHINVRPKAVLVNPTRHRTNLEALFPREGFVRTENGMKPIFLGHPNATCDECERPFRKHEASQEHKGCIVVCGGHLMRLTERKS